MILRNSDTIWMHEWKYETCVSDTFDKAVFQGQNVSGKTKMYPKKIKYFSRKTKSPQDL